MSNTDVQNYIDQAVTRVEENSQRHLESLKEFHRDEVKVMREYMDMRFERLGRDMAEVKSALQMLLEEFKDHREKQRAMQEEIDDLRSRVLMLETQLAEQSA